MSHQQLENEIASVLERQSHLISVSTEPVLLPSVRPSRPRHKSYRITAMATAAVAIAITGVMWTVQANKSTETTAIDARPTTPNPIIPQTDTPTTVPTPEIPWGAEPSSVDNAYLVIGDSDWEIDSHHARSYETFPVAHMRDLQLFRPPGGTLGGPTLVVATTPDPWSPTSEPSEMENIATQHDEGDRIVYIYQPGKGGMEGANAVVVEFPERTVSLAGIDIEQELVVAAANSLTMGTDFVPVVTPPDGLEAVSMPAPHSGQRLQRETSFTNRQGTTNAEVRLRSGTEFDIESQVLGRSLFETDVYRTRTVTVAGVPALVSYNHLNGAGRVFVVGGQAFVIEMDITMPSDSTDADLDALLSTARWVDETEFLALAPKGTVVGSNSNDAIAEITADMPLPTGFDTNAIDTEGSRYHVGAQVSSAVMCAWIEEWIEAKNNGDSERVAAAAGAVNSSHQWAILIELADQGGWSGVVWEYADAINAGGTVGGGMVLTVEESYRDALCP